MMPGMNGIALCQAIRNDENLSHTLLILLSARSEISDQITGLDMGADLYIPKPFDLDYLLATVRNQFRIREQIHSSYLMGRTPKLAEAEVGGETVRFLSQFNRILEEELSNTELSVDLLADKMNMGRASFYNKFTKLTATSPNSYLAKFRLNKAKELMKQETFSISEVSIMTGFRNATYFSTFFKKEMGIPPSEYIRNLSKEKSGTPD